MMRRTSIRRTTRATLLGTLLLAAGCGGGESTTPTTTTAAPTTTVPTTTTSTLSPLDLLTASYDHVYRYSEEVRQLQELLGIRVDVYYLPYTKAKQLVTAKVNTVVSVTMDVE